MRLIAILAAALVVAGNASANVFDPQGSFLSIRIGAFYGHPHGGNSLAQGRAVLAGAPGSEIIVQRGMGLGMGGPNIWATSRSTGGSEFLTGTPNVTNIFLTLQNGTGTFTHNFTGSGFQGATICPGGCFGGTAPLKGQMIVEIAGFLHQRTPLKVVGELEFADRITWSQCDLCQATFLEGAPWVTGTVTITNIATNIISITSGPRSGQTGVAFTLQVRPEEGAIPTAAGEFAVTAVAVAGSTSFSPASGGAGVSEVTLISPIHINSSDLFQNPPVPGLGVQVLRFVPEPGRLLSLTAGVAGLLAVGRGRMTR